MKLTRIIILICFCLSIHSIPALAYDISIKQSIGHTTYKDIKCFKIYSEEITVSVSPYELDRISIDNNPIYGGIWTTSKTINVKRFMDGEPHKLEVRGLADTYFNASCYFISDIPENENTINIDGIFYNIISQSNLEVEVTHTYNSHIINGYNYSYYGNIIIPSTINYNNRTYTVTKIGDYAFGSSFECSGISGCHITSIEIPASITSIGNYAFANSMIKKIIIPENTRLETIGYYAFSNCESLTNINIPLTTKEIGLAAFINCSLLQQIELGPDISKINDNCFSGCSSLSEIILGESITNIGSHAFENCTSLSLIRIPNSVESMQLGAFLGCTNLRTVILGTNINTIASNAFSSCPNLLEVFYTSINKPNSKVNGINSYMESYVPSSKIYGFGKDYINFKSDQFYYSGQSHSIEWENNIKYLACEIFDAETEINAGDHLKFIQVKYSGEINLSLEIPYQYTINRAPLILEIANAEREYGEPNPTFTFSIDGFVNGEELSSIGSTPTLLCDASEISDVGEYKIYASFNPKNYSVQIIEGILSIYKAPISLKIIDTTKKYGEVNPSFCYNLVGLKFEDKEIFSELPYIYSEATEKSEVGVFLINGSGGKSKNYEIKEYLSGKLTIVKAPLILKAMDATKIYLTENPDFDYTLIGLVNEDNKLCLTKEPQLSCEATSNSKWGEYAIIPSNAEAKNYDISYQEGILTVILGEEHYVKEILLSSYSLKINEGDIMTLSFEILPETAVIRDVLWTSDNPEIVSITEEGRLKGEMDGETIIKATATDGSNVYGACTVSVNGITFEHEGICYQRNSPSSLKIVNNSESPYSGDLIIPSSAIFDGQEMSVTEIGIGAFSNCDNLTSIVIPNTITKIKESSFNGCSNLEFVKICDGSILDNNIDILFPDSPINDLYVGSDAITYNDDSRILGIIKGLTLGNSISTFPPSKAFKNLKYFIVEDGDMPIVEPEDYCTKTMSKTSQQTIRDAYTKIYYRFFYLIEYTHLAPVLTALQNGILDYIHVGRVVQGVEVDKSKEKETKPTIEGGLAAEQGWKDEYYYSYYESIAKTDYNRNPIESIEFEKQEIILAPDENVTLKVLFQPSNASFTLLNWSCSDERIATVDRNGVVSKHAVGEVTITVVTTDGSNLSATCKVIDPIMVEGIILNKTSVSLYENETIQLTAIVKPENATERSLIWISSNEEVATVSDDGLVLAVSAGHAVITAKCGDVTTECNVEVLPVIFADSISLNEYSVSIIKGNTFQLMATIEPEDVTDKTIVWESDNEKVVTVSDDGLVTAMEVGNAKITASCGDVSAVCEVVVNDIDGICYTLNEDEQINVYSVNGILIKERINANELNDLDPGIYIIQTSKGSFKIQK